MTESEFDQVLPEIVNATKNRRLFRCFQTTDLEYLLDLKLDDSRILLVNLTPTDPRTYLTRRKLRDVERSAIHPSGFVQYINNRIVFGDVLSVAREEGATVLRLNIAVTENTVAPESYVLVIQLLGGRSNIFLLDSDNNILSAARTKDILGQRPGDIYIPPDSFSSPTLEITPSEQVVTDSVFAVSDKLDGHYKALTEKARFESLSRAALKKASQDLKKKQKLAQNLRTDRSDHGDPDQWKRFGDLLLASVHTARREAGAFVVTDYFDPELAEVRIEADHNDPPTLTAEKYFRKYTRARNAAAQIEQRMVKANEAISAAEKSLEEVKAAVAIRDEEFLNFYLGEKPGKVSVKTAKKSSDTDKAVRTFISTDGFEILVGKKAKDNDQLTFRLAKSLDTWMHAADYPGSHVVIRNPNRKEIPSRTLVEAAEIAAFYSQGRSQPKAAVNYTLKKFVNKPKGSPPGLVSLASFKTLLVEPKVTLQIKAS